MCQGLSNQQIADLLGVTLGTIKLHVHHAMVRSGVNNRTHLAMEFMKGVL